MRLFDVMHDDGFSRISLGHGVEFPGGTIALQMSPGTFVSLHSSVDAVTSFFGSVGISLEWHDD